MNMTYNHFKDVTILWLQLSYGLVFLLPPRTYLILLLLKGIENNELRNRCFHKIDHLVFLC